MRRVQHRLNGLYARNRRPSAGLCRASWLALDRLSSLYEAGRRRGPEVSIFVHLPDLPGVQARVTGAGLARIPRAGPAAAVANHPFGLLEGPVLGALLPRVRAAVGPAWNAAAAVPFYFGGANSALFQLLGLVHPKLRTVLLPHEFLNKQRAEVELRIGHPAPRALGNDSQWASRRLIAA
jgi:putative hemolysin